MKKENPDLSENKSQWSNRSSRITIIWAISLLWIFIPGSSYSEELIAINFWGGLLCITLSRGIDLYAQRTFPPPNN